MLFPTLFSLAFAAFAAGGSVPKVRLTSVRSGSAALARSPHPGRAATIRLAPPAVSAALPRPAIRRDARAPVARGERRSIPVLPGLSVDQMPDGAFWNFFKNWGAAFDGGGRSESVLFSKELAEQEQAAAKLLANLDIADETDPRAEKVLGEMIRAMMKSPTARRLALRMADQLAKIQLKLPITFVDKPETSLITINGVKQPSGNPAEFLSALVPEPEATDQDQQGGFGIALNKHLLDSDPAFLRREGTVFLAHELLGHGLGHALAAEHGLNWVYDVWRDNETNSGLVEWITALELGSFPSYPMYMELYAEDPERYHEELHLTFDFYATTYSAEETANVTEVLKKRLARLGPAASRAKERRRVYGGWLRYVDHLVQKRGWPAGRFEQLREEFSNQVVYAEQMLERYKGMQKALKMEIKHHKKPEVGQLYKEIKGLMTSHPFFLEAAAEVAALTETLHRHLRNPPPAPAAPLEAPEEKVYGMEQVSFEELQSLRARDRDFR